MKGTCYWCHAEIASGQVKRCSRCRLTTYCTKECQVKAWQAGHKNTCTLHKSIVDASGRELPEPPRGSDAWLCLQEDKKLSAWLERWRHVLVAEAMTSLDLANHPPERVATHCMAVWIRENAGTKRKIRDYYIEEACVMPVSELRAEHPDLAGLAVDTAHDLQRMRYAVFLVDDDDIIRLGRCCQFSYLGVDKLRRKDKAASARDARRFADALLYMTDEMTPEELKLGTPRKEEA
ncbi:zinc finger MYND domain-containing protein [Phanerochaete sordida]|uniref:Zinc finger MYND domain-containing protein n=1 Tax=Phanerochaete sordida TaxID=48140 RepID=A0A9P3G7L3_9APHY|nr:zinc finger MYND domain-containing protein [Phanerochaete sordida]